jgi:hypothetical protein
MVAVVTPHCTSQSAKRSRSSVKVANTRTGFLSCPGGTATNISRAPASIPAALGSNTGRSSKHIPLFRLRRLGFVLLDCRWSSCGNVRCSLSELQANGQVARGKILFQTESAGCPQLLTTALRTGLGTTLVIGVVKHPTAYTAYFRCVLLDQRMQESLRRAKFLSALPRPPAGPPLVRHSQRQRGETDRLNLRSMALALDPTKGFEILPAQRAILLLSISIER